MVTPDSDEIPVLIRIDLVQHDSLLQRVQDIQRVGATIIETIPQFGIIVARFPEKRIAELRNIDGVVSVERSRRLTY